MDKTQLLEKVKAGNFNQEKLIGWITAMPQTTLKVRPNEYKVGDVLMHIIFKHPYILLAKKDNKWVCGLFTSEETFPDILEPCKSRFFTEAFFVKSLFTVTEVEGTFMGIYDNTKHLKEVYTKLKKEFVD